MKDDVVVREDDNRPLDVDPVKLIGENALMPHNAGLWGHPPNIVCIRNPAFGGIYVIMRVDQSYEDVVAGVVKEVKRTKLPKEEDDE